MATKAKNQGPGSLKRARRTSGSRTAAVRSLCMSRGSDRAASGGEQAGLDLVPLGVRSGAHPAVAPLPSLVGEDGFEQVAPAEVRPERLGHPDLGVGDLPEQEVAHPQLAR